MTQPGEHFGHTGTCVSDFGGGVVQRYSVLCDCLESGTQAPGQQIQMEDDLKLTADEMEPIR